MSTFDKRQEGFEKKFAHDEELKFKAEARRNRLLGMWAADKLGLSGDAATAYDLMSRRCKDKESLAEFAPIAKSAAELYGQVDYTIDSVTVDGDHGTVDATYAVDALNSPGGSTWLLEDGGWHSDKCG